MFFDAHHVRNNLAGLLHDDDIPDANIFPLNLFRVVQAGSTDGCASQFDRLQFGNGRNGPGLADLDANLFQPRGTFIFLELIGNQPTRTFGCRSQSLALVKPIDFQHEAIDFEVQFVQLANQYFGVLNRFIQFCEALHARCGGQTILPNLLEEFHVRLGLQPFRITDTMTEAGASHAVHRGADRAVEYCRQ